MASLDGIPHVSKHSAPLVTIGLPVYNGEKFLEHAMRTLLSQTFRDFELIVSDNASTDGTAALCERIARTDARVRYVRQQQNLGALGNFNFVLQEARGRLFMWAAHDDEWDPGWLEALVFQIVDGVSIAFGRVVQVDARGKVLRTCPRFEFLGGRFRRSLSFVWAEEWNGKANVIYGLMPTEQVQRLGFHTIGNATYGTDMHFIFRMLQDGVIVSAPTVTLQKRYVEPAFAGPRPNLVRRMLLIERVPYYLAYPRLMRSPLDKTLLYLCLPIVYLKAVTGSAWRVAKRRITSR